MTTQVAAKEDQPVFEYLGYEGAFRPCDGHEATEIRALVTVLLPSGGMLELCGSCCRKLGFDHTAHAVAEDKQKGSSH